MMIKIFSGTSLVRSVDRVLDAEVSERLSGEFSLSFSLIADPNHRILPGMLVEHHSLRDDFIPLVSLQSGSDTTTVNYAMYTQPPTPPTLKVNSAMRIELTTVQLFTVVRVSYSLNAGLAVCAVECEHISYKLNDTQYDLPAFVFSGEPEVGLTQLLAGTPFSAGVVEPSGNVAVALVDGNVNRRNHLINFVNACGGEIEYDEDRINIRNHRGMSTRKYLMDTLNVTNVSATFEGREGVAAYEIELFEKVIVNLGDEVNITFNPLSINVNTRVVGITYNPFYHLKISVEVGGYVPDYLSEQAEKINRVHQEFVAADGQLLSRIWNDDGGLSEIHQTLTTISFTVQSAEGNISTLEQTAVSLQSQITGVGGDVSTLTQTAVSLQSQITNANGDISTLSQTATSLQSQITGVNGAVTTISQKVDSLTLSASNGSTSSTLTLKSGSIPFQLIMRVRDASGTIKSTISDTLSDANKSWSWNLSRQYSSIRRSKLPFSIEFTVYNAVGGVLMTQTAYISLSPLPQERPDNWSWYYPHNVGSDIIVTAAEWNAFTARINAFRAYWGLSAYSFTPANSGNSMYASQYNDACYAIGGMSGAFPSTTTPGANITAAQFTALADYLNSLS